MSEPKKPGARDISDLKARLGLKKGAEGGAAPRSTQAINAQGVPAPSGGKLGGGFVPPPPGVAPPPSAAPPQPVIPDASVDPFGAMNAMAGAARSAAPHQPEFVIVNDGKAVEHVGGSKSAARWFKVALFILPPLFVGYVFGGINKGNQDFNKTVEDAKYLYEDFNAVGKGLTDLQGVLDVAKDRGHGDFKYPDPELNTALEGLKLAAPDTTVLFHSNVHSLDAGEVEKIFKFYIDLTALYVKLDEHKRLSKIDAKKAAPKPNGNYAVVLRMPPADKPDQIPMVEIVELGAPVCAGQTKASPEGCPAGTPVEKFQVRTNPQGQWAQILPFTTKEIAADSILAIMPNDEQGAFMMGADNFVDAVGYRRRIIEIDGMVRELSESRASLQTLLNAEAQRGKRFSL